MGESAEVYTLTVNEGASIAFRHFRPAPAAGGARPGVVFCGGFRSDMNGIKATALAAHCRDRGQALLRFDYSGHGASSGRFEDGTIGAWLADTLAVIDRVAVGRQILVGSSMGGWIAVLAALARPERIAGLVGVASAPDFTESLVWQVLGEDQRAALRRDGSLLRPSEYDAGGDPITLRLIEEARDHLVLDRPIAVTAPVRLIHGMADRDVPWQLSLRLAERITGADSRLILVKDGEHRMNRRADLALMLGELDRLSDCIAGAAAPGSSRAGTAPEG